MGQQHSFEESSHSNEGWHEGREGKGSGSRDGGGGGTCSIFPKIQHKEYHLHTRGIEFYLRVFNYLRVFDKSEHSE